MLGTKEIDYIIFNDTDSMGINCEGIVSKTFPSFSVEQTPRIIQLLDKVCKEIISPFITEELEKLADYMNMRTRSLSMVREILADKGLWRGKKNYILRVWDKEGVRYETPKLKIMGIETAKSSTPTCVRRALEKGIKIILDEDEVRLQNFVEEFRKEFLELSIEDISSPRGVNDLEKWITITGQIKKGVPIHVRGSLIYNKIIKEKALGEYPVIHSGDKIKYIYLKLPNPFHSHIFSFPDKIPPGLDLEKWVDKELQFEKTFLHPLQTLTSIAGLNIEKKNSIESFWA